MRLHFGSIPENTEFQASGDWVAAREPPAWLVQWVLSVPVSILLALLAAMFIIRYTKISSEGLSLAGLLLLSFVLVVVHELVHVVTHPDRGMSRRTILGFWPSRLVFFAHYDGPRTKSNFLLCLIAPFLVLTVAPLIASTTASWDSWVIGTVMILNAALSSIDVLGFFFVLVGVPGGAWVQNRGWHTYWKHPHNKPLQHSAREDAPSG